LDTAVKMKNSFTNNYVSIDWKQDIKDAINQSLVQTDQAKKQAMVWDAMKKIEDDYAILNTGVFQTQMCFSYPQVKDINIYAPLDRLWNPENAWLSK
jgi:hypothetical protein